MRYVIECRWSGYSPGQERVCHRSVTVRRGLAEKINRVHTVQFTDGTTMSVYVRQAHKREKVKEMKAYTGLLEDVAHREMIGFVRVADLLPKVTVLEYEGEQHELKPEAKEAL